MLDSIPVVDAAAAVNVDETPALRLVAFVRYLTSYVATRDEAAARYAISSPFSGLPSVDARALCVAAGERRTLAETIERDAIPLPHETSLAARRFARALGELLTAYRAQGATALEHLATIALAFDLALLLDARERATYARLETIARTADAARPAGEAWDAAAFVRALERYARAAPPPRRPQNIEASPRHPELVEGHPERVEGHPRSLEGEPERVVRRRKAHASASSLGTYAECERKWFYRYVCAAVEDRGSSASTYGTAFHWALERFHQEYTRADAAPAAVLERKLEGYLNTAFERYRSGFETNVEYELQRRRAQRTGRRYLAWFLERASRHPFTVIGTEAMVELELEGYRFIGYIDRLDLDDATSNVTVVDYKTGNIAESAEEYRSKVARFVDFQLPFYYWARTAAGERVTRLALVPLKDAARDVTPIELEVVPVSTPRTYSDATTGTIGIDELERARTRMVELAAVLAEAPLERFPVTNDPDACRYCAYRNSCRERPLPREDRFGR
jgi:CRISPR/Cas system-associated exonuclease Cas4 (RecB family)